MYYSVELGGGHGRLLSRTSAIDYFSDTMDPSVVPPTLSSVAPFLRVAFDVEAEAPRVAYLCFRHALLKANEIDPHSRGRRVMQFKTALCRKLEEREATHDASDVDELYSYYQKLLNRAKSLEPKSFRSMDRIRLRKTYHMASVLYEVLEAIIKMDSREIPAEMLESGKELASKQDMCAAYNILPLDPTSSTQAVMMLPEVKLAISAICNIRGLPWPIDVASTKGGVGVDLFDWLQIIFGFQASNVLNQKEHLILLLANAQMGNRVDKVYQNKLDDVLLSNLGSKMFKNYRKWCKHLGCECNLRVLTNNRMQQRQLLYLCLYLLIWGEAANVRFMPECLCYIFHHMAGDVNFLLDNIVSSEMCQSIRLVYGGQDYSFLTRVVTPMYNIIRKEVERSKSHSHSTWRNYDDLNEYFWSTECFCLGWPWKVDAVFFRTCDPSSQVPATGSRQRGSRPGKTRYVEIRSFLHIFRSFKRMWSFFILALQAMLLLAWDGSGSVSNTSQAIMKVSSIFISAAILDLFQALVEIGLSIKAWKSMRFNDILWYASRAVTAVVWSVILPVSYTHAWESPTGLVGTLRAWLGHSSRRPYMYVTCVVIYLVPSAINAFLFFFPKLRRVMERSHWWPIHLFLWWSQPGLFVGRGMHETQYMLFKYTLFWIVLLTNKFLFSFFFEIRPLVGLTKQIINVPMGGQYSWHEFFPNERGNILAVVALWTPVLLVYFMDTQIWYALWSAIFGGINGAFSRLEEIRSLEMLRSRFSSLSGSFQANLMHCDAQGPCSKSFSFSCSFAKVAPADCAAFTRFSLLWNEVITSLRKEDLIDNLQRDLLLAPRSSDPMLEPTVWPAFLLASKVPKAVSMVQNATESWGDDDIIKMLNMDEYMIIAINECYSLFVSLIQTVVKREVETNIIEEIRKDLEKYVTDKKLLKLLRINAIPLLYSKFLELLDLLDKLDQKRAGEVASLLQDMLEIYHLDLRRDKRLCDAFDIDDLPYSFASNSKLELFDKNALCLPLADMRSWRNKIKRLHLLLLPEESVLEIPTNASARRRLTFFASSLFMDMPPPPKVENMISFSVLTPYHDEETLFTQGVLETENDEGISILDYLQHIHPDEWSNFQERLRGLEPTALARESCKWASFRLPTLARTVRGMMYYAKALELQAFLDMASDKDVEEGYKAARRASSTPKQSLFLAIQALVDLKFTFVVSCQEYVLYRRTQDYRQKQILELLREYPALRMAYIDEKEGAEDKEFYSVLVKGFRGTNFHQEVYRIKLPGDPMIGEGKSENQNHSIIFTRGEALQVIDMNEDNYLEEALKMRNFLEEFRKDSGIGPPSILGIREYNFTESNSSLAGFISRQESSFVTIGQRILVNPLRVRFHYGHSDMFDRLFHITRGGLSKASRVINTSESMYAGFNTTLRGGSIMHKQYIQVGKGQNVRFSQIFHYHAKSAVGNAEQIMSRDIYRLGYQLDFFRMLSVYFTTVGYYVSNLMLVLTVYTFLYGRLYLALSGLEKGLIKYVGLQSSRPLQAALATESFVIFGLFMAAPVVVEIGLEHGFRRAFRRFLLMQLKLASLFFAFVIGTKAHFFGWSLLHGGAHYPQGAEQHEFFLCHETFAQNYRLYSRSHFTKAIELFLLLIVYHVYGASQNRTASYYLIHFSLWLLVGAWAFAPFLFNPQGLEWEKTIEDWFDWLRWIKSSGKRGMPAISSWESWWDEEQSHLDHVSLRSQLGEVILAARFFLYQYGIVYHLNIVHQRKSIVVYVISWLVVVLLLAILKAIALSRRALKQTDRLFVRFLKVGVVAALMLTMIGLFVVGRLTIVDVFASAVAFMPSGWAILQISLVCKQLALKAGVWDTVKGLARCYDYAMGLVVFAPIAALSWIPMVSDSQVCILFNRSFLNFLMSRQQKRRKKAWFFAVLSKYTDDMYDTEDD